MGEAARGAAPTIVSFEDITAAHDPVSILEAVRHALINHALGRMIVAPPSHLVFDDPPGDCHVKMGMRRGDDHFVVKVATGMHGGFDGRPSVNGGVVLVMSAVNGGLRAVLGDQGCLTSWRTAAAGALALHVGAPQGCDRIGILGTGHQAELQAVWGSRILDGTPVVVWGRRPDQARRLCDRLEAQGVTATPVRDLDAVLDRCRAIITCTTAAAPIVPADRVRPGTHVVAVGADMPGKCELDPALFARANGVATDDHDQCLAHGEFGCAVTSGHIAPDADVALGAALAGDAALRRHANDITIVDLTGVAAQDVAMADLVWRADERWSGGRKDCS